MPKKSWMVSRRRLSRFKGYIAANTRENSSYASHPPGCNSGLSRPLVGPIQQVACRPYQPELALTAAPLRFPQSCVVLPFNLGYNCVTMKDSKISRDPSPVRSRAKPTSRRARPKRKRREQQRAIDTRTIILEAALTEFAQRGFDGASTRRIGDRLGIQHPLITYHYRTKDILWRAVAEYAFAEIRETWDIRIPPDSSLSAVDRVREEFRAFLQFTIQHVDFHQFMLWESMPGSSRLKWLVKNMLQPTMNRLVPQIAEAQKDGDLPAGDPILIYYMLIGCMSVLSSLRDEMRATSGLDGTDSAVTESYWRIVDATIFGR